MFGPRQIYADRLRNIRARQQHGGAEFKGIPVYGARKRAALQQNGPLNLDLSPLSRAHFQGRAFGAVDNYGGAAGEIGAIDALRRPDRIAEFDPARTGSEVIRDNAALSERSRHALVQRWVLLDIFTHIAEQRPPGDEEDHRTDREEDELAFPSGDARWGDGSERGGQCRGD